MDQGQFEAETKNYIYFYEVWLKDILGYDLDENVLVDEKEEHGRGKSEFILKSGDKKFMVVELKDQKTDLDKPQNRFNDKRTPVDQAFDYAQHTGDIDWILVSNYNEFRLYNWHKKGHYISFKVGELLDKTLLSYFLLSFSKKSYIDTGYIDKLMDKTVVIEKELEKEFYKLYNETRLMLIKELEEINKFDRIKAVHYAQLILNRYMFIAFAEDMDLLPSQISTDTIIGPIKSKDIGGNEIWHRLNNIFRNINLGNEIKDIYAYNGGLFKEDLEFIHFRDILEDQKFFNDVYQKWNFVEYEKDIDPLVEPYGNKINPIFRNLLTISSFDFSSELDVNILGHIFENSIGDIEELKADKKGRRKKEGIFYTPEHITDYICRNTIIRYLSKSGKANTVKDLLNEYPGSEIEVLEEIVNKIKIVDPACGSGAFLNKAGDILVEIHQAIREHKYRGDTSLIPFFDTIEERRKVLLDNIYGVDINEESVEITKLSLFLKVCKKGITLPKLDDNIKCGNSVIQDPKFASDKAFSWENTFKDVFENGGFDIVIGNPPYGTRTVLTTDQKDFIRNVEKIPFKSGDSAEVFCKKCFDKLLKPNGILGFIIPKKSLYGESWSGLRMDYWKKYDLIFLLDTSKSFNDVLLEAASFGIRKSMNQSSKVLLSYLNEENIINEFSEVEKEYIFQNNNTVQIYKILFTDLYEKVVNDSYIGLASGDLGLAIGTKFYSDSPKEYKLLKGIDIRKWAIKENRYLDNKENLKWDDARRFLKPKVIAQRIIAHIENPNPHIKITACFDEEGIIITNTLTAFKLNEKIDPKFWLAYLNSKFLSFYTYNFIYSRAIRTMDFYDFYIQQLPVPKIMIEDTNKQKSIINNAELLIQLNKSMQDEINKTKSWLNNSFGVEKFTEKIEKYYKLDSREFLDELKKQINTKSRKNSLALTEGFEESKAVINPLLLQIKETDSEIDKMVYDLYGLTPEEIKIIEDTLNV
jgi:tRNA1(Val) A37 N6-methylase TrmN6